MKIHIKQTVLLFLLTVLTSLPLFAEEDLNWSRLLNHIESAGVHMSTYVGDYLTLSNVQPNDRSQERIASYISLVGVLMEDGTFFRRRVEVVWEDWRFDQDRNFRVEQWLIALDLSGNFTRRSRSILIMSQSGSKLGEENPVTSDSEFQLKWKNIQQEWYKIVP